MIEKFTVLESAAAPLPQDDIDTDIIYPARFLLITDREGLARYGFHDWRFDAEGAERPDFALARAPWRNAQILVTGANVGCGSSREHAPWALADMGIRCVIAPSFGEIFCNNCFKNGLLPIVAEPADHAALLADAEGALRLRIDLAAGQITRSDGSIVQFEVDAERRDALLNGWDEIETILAASGPDIAAFEAAQRIKQPWLWTREQTA